jgi:hypothetical protein
MTVHTCVMTLRTRGICCSPSFTRGGHGQLLPCGGRCKLRLPAGRLRDASGVAKNPMSPAFVAASTGVSPPHLTVAADESASGRSCCDGHR